MAIIQVYLGKPVVPTDFHGSLWRQLEQYFNTPDIPSEDSTNIIKALSVQNALIIKSKGKVCHSRVGV